MGNITGAEGYNYGMDDVIWTLKLFYFYYQHEAFNDTYYSFFKESIIAAVGDHYINGQFIDTAVLEALHIEDIKERQKILSEHPVLKGINLDSPNQVSKLLFEDLKLPIVKVSKKTGKPSTDKEVLNSLIEDFAEEYPAIKAFSNLRTIGTREKLYYKPFPFLLYPDGKMHSEIRPTGTVTGRFSMSGPNLQQLSKRGEGVKVRRIFVPAPGHDYVVSVDWSQIELRMAAHLSQDPKLLDAYRTDKDLHTVSGTNIISCSFEEMVVLLEKGDTEAKKARQKGKTLNFAALYGASAQRLAKFDLLNCTTGEAEAFLQLHKQGYASYFYDYWERTLQDCRDKMYVKTLFGNRRSIPDIISPIKSIRAEAQNKVVNAIVQGSCSELMCSSLASLYNQNLLYNDDITFIAPIHDEFVFSMTKKGLLKYISQIKNIMEEAPEGFTVPIKASVSFGLNFADQVEVGDDISIIESLFEKVDNYSSKGN
jgi:DNA polymerase-1